MKDLIDRNALLYMGLVTVILHQNQQSELVGMNEHEYAIDCYKAGMPIGFCADVITSERQRANTFNIHSIGQGGRQSTPLS